MSKENVLQFMEQVATSEELQVKIPYEIDAEALIALGAECGCEFTAEELQDSAAYQWVRLAGRYKFQPFFRSNAMRIMEVARCERRGEHKPDENNGCCKGSLY